MTVRYFASIKSGTQSNSSIPIKSFSLKEEYSKGWHGEIVVESPLYKSPISLDVMLLITLRSGLSTGKKAILSLESIEAGKRTVLRDWPIVITNIESARTDNVRRKAALITFADPVGFLSSRPIWGAYGEASVGEIFGGALSMAAGGDGKPGRNPALPNGMPTIEVSEAVRSSIARIPYVIAVGETLGDWLDEVLGELGVRYEMQSLSGGNSDVGVLLTDQRADPDAYAFSSIPVEEIESAGGGSDALIDESRVQVISLQAGRGASRRGGIIDDIEDGRFRRFGAGGAPARVCRTSGLDPEEANLRSSFEVKRAFLDMIQLRITSQQVQIRPGRSVNLIPAMVNVNSWQVAGVDHYFSGTTYNNMVLLLRNDESWHPQRPAGNKPVAIVTGVVDGGSGFRQHQPISRDRTGRIPISFPFMPVPEIKDRGAHEEAFRESDRDESGEVTLNDFSPEEIEKYEDETERTRLEVELERYRSGDYADPYPGRRDDGLSEQELQARNEMFEKRVASERYRLYKQAKLKAYDIDGDGEITTMDEGLESVLEDETKRNELEQALESYDRDGVYPENFMGKMVVEDDDSSGGDNTITKTELRGWLDAYRGHKLVETSEGNWPPRLPLRVVSSMAGASHGFLAGHRHLDTCRVAIYNPMAADVVGFGYRNDRRLSFVHDRALAGISSEVSVEFLGEDEIQAKKEEMEAEQGEQGGQEEVRVENPVIKQSGLVFSPYETPPPPDQTKEGEQ